MEIVKGQTFEISLTVYSVWTGDLSTSTVTNLTAATIKCYVKKRDGDPDSAAILTINGALVDAINGLAKINFTAADTNSLSYANLVMEVVTKLADGTFIRTGVEPFDIKPNVGKTLF